MAGGSSILASYLVRFQVPNGVGLILLRRAKLFLVLLGLVRRRCNPVITLSLGYRNRVELFEGYLDPPVKHLKPVRGPPCCPAALSSSDCVLYAENRLDSTTHILTLLVRSYSSASVSLMQPSRMERF